MGVGPTATTAPEGGSLKGPPRGGRVSVVGLGDAMNFEFVLLAGQISLVRRPRRRVSPQRLTWFVVNLVRRSLACVYVPRHGARVVSVHSGLGCLGEPLAYFQPPEFRIVKRRVVAKAEGSVAPALVNQESKLLAQLPHLVNHLSVTRYEDGEPRTTGTAILKVLGTAWVVVLKEPDAAAQMQVTAATLDDALVLADLLLGSDGAPWEPDPWAKRQNGQGKKKS